MLNPEKCEYLVFNAKYRSSYRGCGSFSVKLDPMSFWLRNSICSFVSVLSDLVNF